MVTFQELWDSHPSILGDHNPCTTGGVPNFQNQCCIRMGQCFVNDGVSMHDYDGVFCWFNHGRTHPLRVEEFADWLDRKYIDFGFVATEIKTDVTYQDYLGHTGIVVFKNFWGEYGAGDHIDLWDGYDMCSGDRDYFERSQVVWFWEVD